MGLSYGLPTVWWPQPGVLQVVGGSFVFCYRSFAYALCMQKHSLHHHHCGNLNLLLMFSLSSCSYLEKFTDFLRLFVSVHLRRIESSPQFPIVEFLALLFKYTFNQVLIIWSQSFVYAVHQRLFISIGFLQNMSFDRLENFLLVGFTAYPWRLLCLFGYMERLFGFSNNQNQKQTCWQRKCSKQVSRSYNLFVPFELQWISETLNKKILMISY